MVSFHHYIIMHLYAIAITLLFHMHDDVSCVRAWKDFQHAENHQTFLSSNNHIKIILI